MIKCPECGKEVSSEAKSCPNCGKPITKKNKHLGCLIGILVAIIIGVIIGLYNRSVSEDYIDTTKSSSPSYNQNQILSKTLGCINEETYSVVSKCMLKKDFDIVLIAVSDNRTANSIKNSLLDLGVSEEKILYREPERL